MNIQKANQLFQQEKYEDALLAYENIVSQNPDFGKYISFNIELAKSRLGLGSSPLKNNQTDVFVVIWLALYEPIHDIILQTIEDLHLECINARIFARESLVGALRSKAPYLEHHPSSFLLHNALIPTGLNLPESFIERSPRLLEYLIKREEQWLNDNQNINIDNSIENDIIRGIRYWTKIVSIYSPKIMLIWGSSSPVSALLIEICNQKSIQYYIIERGILPGTLIVDENAQFGYSYSNKLLSSTPDRGFEDKSYIDRLNSYLNVVSSVPYKNFNKPFSAHLNSDNRPIILFIGSNDLGSLVSLKDSYSQPCNLSEYKSSWEVACDLAKSISLISSGALLYIKPHPSDKRDYYSLESENVKVYPETNINDLIDHSTICCTLCSTAIAICLLKKKPLVTFSSTDVSNLGVAYEIYRKSEVISQLRNAFLKINYNQKLLNSDNYFQFALNYRLYFQQEHSEFGNVSSNLARRIFKVASKEFKKSELLPVTNIRAISSPLYFRINKNCTINYPPTDIIIPIYDGYDLTKACIDYAKNLLTKSPNVNLILINDCSPCSKLSEYLNQLNLSGFQNIRVHKNDVNVGFSGSVNIGIALSRPEADILLLNSDAFISNYCVSSLQITAYSNPKIATVCPLSTEGGLMTVFSNIDNSKPLSQDKLDLVNKNLDTKENRQALLLPVNHGACLYIKKSALNLVGCFNELVFGRGYSEEIDFCMRLRKHNLHNVGCCFSFVQHVGAVSFGQDSNPLKVKNRSIIAEKYPRYFSEVKSFLYNLRSSEQFTQISKLIDIALAQ